MINNFTEEARYKINLEKPVAFRNNNKIHIPIHKSLKENKVPRRNLNKQVKDLYNENFKSLKKDIEEGTKVWKDSHTHGFVELVP